MGSEDSESTSVAARLRRLGRILAGFPRPTSSALASTLIDLFALALATVLLHVLWAPIQVELAGGQLVSPQALLLLVGFVAVWLALVLAFGALHAWVSGWWSLELGHAGEGSRPTLQEANP